MKEKIILLGCGGHAKSIVDAIEAADTYEIAGFIDNDGKGDFEYRGYKIIGCDAQLQEIYNLGIHCACVCVGFLGQGRVRNKLYTHLKQIGFTLPVIVDPSAVLARDVRIEEGTFIGKQAVVNSNAVIGKMVIINTAAVVEHDSIIADFCHISISSVVCGGAYVGENVFVGSNATIIQNVRVGLDAIVGAGSIVIKNVEDHMQLVNKIISIYKKLDN